MGMKEIEIYFSAWHGIFRTRVVLESISGMGDPWHFSISFLKEGHKGNLHRRQSGEWVGPDGFPTEDIQAMGERIEEYIAIQNEEIKKRFNEENAFTRLK